MVPESGAAAESSASTQIDEQGSPTRRVMPTIRLQLPLGRLVADRRGGGAWVRAHAFGGGTADREDAAIALNKCHLAGWHAALIVRPGTAGLLAPRGGHVLGYWRRNLVAVGSATPIDASSSPRSTR